MLPACSRPDTVIPSWWDCSQSFLPVPAGHGEVAPQGSEGRHWRGWETAVRSAPSPSVASRHLPMPSAQGGFTAVQRLRRCANGVQPPARTLARCGRGGGGAHRAGWSKLRACRKGFFGSRKGAKARRGFGQRAQRSAKIKALAKCQQLVPGKPDLGLQFQWVLVIGTTVQFATSRLFVSTSPLLKKERHVVAPTDIE